MKNILAICFLLIGSSLFAQKKVDLVIDWVFTGIIENYDHNNRIEVYVDGKNVATSTSTKQSKKNSLVVPIPKGVHKVKIVNYAEYQGDWEPHSVANDYSLDAVYEFNSDFTKKKKVSLVFDINQEIVIVK